VPEADEMTSDQAKRVPSDDAFSSQLDCWLRADGVKTVGGLEDVFGEKAFAVTILFLMFIPAFPLPTGGITHVFAAITVILAVEMVLGVRTMWIPARLRHRDLGSLVTGKAIPFMVRRIRWFERFSHPRWATLVSHGWFHRLMGVVFIGLAVATGLAPPFSGLDTLPAMGAVVVALGLILEDVVVIGIGALIGTGGIVLILTVGAALFNIVRHLL
jgi:hypothetical protein